jgi:hypothetical protein
MGGGHAVTGLVRAGTGYRGECGRLRTVDRCFTAALLLLYCCFTAALLLLYCCFTAALLLLYCCFIESQRLRTVDRLPIRLCVSMESVPSFSQLHRTITVTFLLPNRSALLGNNQREPLI